MKNKKVIGIIVAVIALVAIGVGIYFAVSNSNGAKKPSNTEKTTVSTTVDYEKNFKGASVSRDSVYKAVHSLAVTKIGLKGQWSEYSLLQDTQPLKVDKTSYFKFVIKKATDKFTEDAVIKTLYVSYDGKTLYYTNGNVENVKKADIEKYKHFDISKEIKAVNTETTTKK